MPLEQNKNIRVIIEDKPDEAGCYGYKRRYGDDRIRSCCYDVDDGYWRLIC